MADVLLVHYGAVRFSWGAGNLAADGEVRQRYLHPLRAADAKDYHPPLASYGHDLVLPGVIT